MDNAEVQRQIQQMVQFIMQEANEKVGEIQAAAEEEFNIEKLQLVESEKRKLRQEYEKKEKQLEIRKKIDYSKKLNDSRLTVLQAQDDAVNKMKISALDGLLAVAADTKQYRKLLKDLIAQGLWRLKEPAVILRCREIDRRDVESVLDEAKQQYEQYARRSPVPFPVPKITIDLKVFLPKPPPHFGAQGNYCYGGVVLASQDGKIVFENTLDARLDLAFRKKLPEIRQHLFPKE